MKKILVIVTLILVVLFGELCSRNKYIESVNNDTATWNISHFYNTFVTKAYTPVNDTLQVVVKAKTENNLNTNNFNSPCITFSDGTQIISIVDKQIYDSVKIGDSVTLIKHIKPITKNYYKTTYKLK